MSSSNLRSKTEAGLTLIEVLLAAALLAVMAVVLGAAVAGTADTVEALGQEARERHARTALGLLAHDLAAATATPAFPWIGEDAREDGRAADRLAIVSGTSVPALGPGLPPRSSRVVYTRRGDRLTRFATDHLHASAPGPVLQETVATGVTAFNVSYYDDESRAWVDAWDSRAKGQGRLPRAVAVEVTLATGQYPPRTYVEWIALQREQS